MTCCATICPANVVQWEGRFYESTGPLFIGVYQQGWAWSPFEPERDFSLVGEGIAIGVRNDWDEAFEDMENPIIDDFPEELKVECLPVDTSSGPVNFSFRFEWPDSHDCDGDGPEEPLHARLMLRVVTCRTVRVKAKVVGRIENSRSADTGYYDYIRISAVNASSFYNYGPSDCTNPTTFTAISGGCADGEGDDCDMIDRVGCGVIDLCEGSHLIVIEVGTGDALQHTGGFWEAELTFDCSDTPTIDCSEEEEDEDFTEPCGETECELDEDGNAECTPPPPISPGECLCGQCQVQSVRLTVAGLINSSCNFSPSGLLGQLLTANLNGVYTMVWDASESHWEVNLGVLNSQSNPGTPIQVLGIDPGTGDDLYEHFAYRITAQLQCDLDGPTPRLTGSVSIWTQCRTRDSLSPTGTFTPCTPDSVCYNLVFTKLADQDTGEGCSGLSVTYSNANDFGGYGNRVFTVELPGGCQCSEDRISDPPGTIATVKLEPIGVGGEC